MSSSEDEIEAPPERRAPSGRGNKGNRMQRLMADEVEEADEGDNDFYQQAFWAEAAEDVDYDAEQEDDEQAHDSFDSDFGDSTESDDDDDDDDGEKKAAREPKRKSSAYKDPKAKKPRAPPGKAAAPSHKRKPRAPASNMPQANFPSSRTARASTKSGSEAAEARAKALDEAAKARALRRKSSSKGAVEMHRLTQDEILAEARQTEIINRASLAKMLAQEEEKRKVVVRERNTSGPRIKWRSRREGDSVLQTVTFTDCEPPVPDAINATAPRPQPPAKCAVTGAPAKFFDPVTQAPYATLEAFRTLRGRTGGRRSGAA